jgi:hypothetical protein
MLLYSLSTTDRHELPQILKIKRNRRDESYSFPILKIGLPQEAQVPFTAGRPFFKVICLGFLISLFFFFS